MAALAEGPYQELNHDHLQELSAPLALDQPYLPREPPQGAQENAHLPVGRDLVDAAQGGQDRLAGVPSLPVVLHQLHVAALALQPKGWPICFTRTNMRHLLRKAPPLCQPG